MTKVPVEEEKKVSAPVKDCPDCSNGCTVHCGKCKRVKENGKCPACGRPSEYDPKYCDIVIELGRKGYTKAMIAREIDKNYETIEDWRKEYPEFSEAFTRAMMLQTAWYDELGTKNMDNRQFNSRTYELHRMNMHGWNKKNKDELKVEGKLSLTELARKAKES